MTRRRDRGGVRGVPTSSSSRYRLGELPPAEARTLEGRLVVEPDLAVRLDALERSDEEIRRRYPPDWLAEQIRSRRRPAPEATARAARPWLVRWPVPAALAVAATLAIVLGSSAVEVPVP